MKANASSAVSHGGNNDEAPFSLKMYQLFVAYGDEQDDCTPHSDTILC